MVTVLAGMLGALGALIYIVFLAYKIDELPLWIITIGSMALMVYGFILEARDDLSARGGNGRNANP